MTPVQQAKSKLTEWLPVLVPTVTFIIGFGINTITNNLTSANKIDTLTQKVAELSIVINKMSDKIDAKDTQVEGDKDQMNRRISKVTNRVTAVEVKVFGRAQMEISDR